MKQCCITDCPNMVEGRTQMCSTHNRAARKASAPKKEKKPQRISKTADSEREKIYLAIRKIWFSPHFMCRRCDTKPATDVHHAAGKLGDLLYDVRKWIPLCRECHKLIEENPGYAIRAGYSIYRLANDQTI